MIMLTSAGRFNYFFCFEVRYPLRFLHMNLVLWEVGCVLTMENHTTLFHYIHYFLYKSGPGHSDRARADAGVEVSGGRSLVTCFEETQKARCGRMDGDVIMTGGARSRLREVAPEACGRPQLQIAKGAVFIRSLLITGRIRSSSNQRSLLMFALLTSFTS